MKDTEDVGTEWSTITAKIYQYSANRWNRKSTHHKYHPKYHLPHVLNFVALLAVGVRNVFQTRLVGVESLPAHSVSLQLGVRFRALEHMKGTIFLAYLIRWVLKAAEARRKTQKWKSHVDCTVEVLFIISTLLTFISR